MTAAASASARTSSRTKALGGAMDEDAFAKLSGTVSLPFAVGGHNRIAVKMIDPRGNEVLRVHKLSY